LETVTPGVFEDVIRYVRKLGYNFVSLNELWEKMEQGVAGREAVVTFDDGFKDLYLNAYPIMKRQRIPFALFLITSTLDSPKLLWLHKIFAALDRMGPDARGLFLGQLTKPKDAHLDEVRRLRKIIFSSARDQLLELSGWVANEAGLNEQRERRIAEELYLGAEEIREMLQNGLQIESHSHEHWPAPALDVEEMESEIEISCRLISQEFGGKVSFFCLPYGMGLDQVRKCKAVSELRGVLSTRPGLIGNSDQSLEMPRIIVRTDVVDVAYLLTKLFLRSILSRGDKADA
jgi:peptidoglycan/xylan/chitin deacetylase (PgdA/CDA1 family)